MKSTDAKANTTSGEARQNFGSTPASGGITNVSQEDNSPVNMNTPGLKPRGFRADQLVEMAGDDTGRLGTEPPRKDKMKG